LLSGIPVERREKAENLARQIAGEGASPEILELTRWIAEAQIDVIRVRHAKLDLLSSDMNSPRAANLYREWDRSLSEKAELVKILTREGPGYDPMPELYAIAMATPPEPPQATEVEKYCSQESPPWMV
jgi:hypothetical protein